MLYTCTTLEEISWNSRRTPLLVKEGEEDIKFWNAIGGEEEYFRGPEDTVSGTFIARPVAGTVQDSLTVF